MQKPLRNAISLLIALACLFPIAALADYAVVSNPNPQDRLNLRDGPNSAATSIAKYYSGVEVTLHNYLYPDWAEVSIGNQHGYMQLKFLVINATPGMVVSAIPYATIQNPNPTDRLNLRQSPSSVAPSLGKYINGTQVQVLGVGETWWHVRVDGQMGFMMGRYLRLNGGGGGGGGQAQQVLPAQAVVYNANPTDRLNLRSSVSANGTGGASLIKYYTGTPVEAISYVSGHPEWIYVRIGSAYGYMQANYLAFGAHGIRPAFPVKVVNNPNPANRLNLRESSSENSASLGRFANGTLVEVMGIVTGGTWYHVRMDGFIGFMMAKYLR